MPIEGKSWLVGCCWPAVSDALCVARRKEKTFELEIVAMGAGSHPLQKALEIGAPLV